MSIAGEGLIAIDQTRVQPEEAAVGAALAVLDRFMDALNTRDQPALLATLHFPREPILAIFSPVPARTGTTVNGIFAKLSLLGPRWCTWTAIQSLSRRQFGDWFISLLMGRHQN